MKDYSQRFFGLEEKIAVVIGGTGALGSEIAKALAFSGANVAVMGRNAERGEAVCEAILKGEGAAFFERVDVLERDSLEAAQRNISARWGRPMDILVNAAGGNRPDATLQPGHNFSDLPLKAWHEVFDLNLVGGTLLPCQVFGKVMLEAGSGSIINIASMAGMTPLSRVVGYSASKAAVLNLTQFLAREWASHWVRVNAISPGFFPADQNRALLFRPEGGYTERGQQIIDHTPMSRFGRAEEVAGAAVFLASRAASFMTGHNLVVDGGFSAQTI